MLKYDKGEFLILFNSDTYILQKKIRGTAFAKDVLMAQEVKKHGILGCESECENCGRECVCQEARVVFLFPRNRTNN